MSEAASTATIFEDDQADEWVDVIGDVMESTLPPLVQISETVFRWGRWQLLGPSPTPNVAAIRDYPLIVQYNVLREALEKIDASMDCDFAVLASRWKKHGLAPNNARLTVIPDADRDDGGGFIMPWSSTEHVHVQMRYDSSRHIAEYRGRWGVWAASRAYDRRAIRSMSIDVAADACQQISRAISATCIELIPQPLGRIERAIAGTLGQLPNQDLLHDFLVLVDRYKNMGLWPMD